MSAVLPVPTSDAHVDDLSVDDLAVVIGVSWDDLCFYEAHGPVRAQRRNGGYRAYPSEIMELVQYVRAARQLGFTLAEIKEGMSHVWQQPDTDAAVAALPRDKLAMIDAHIVNLQAIRNILATCVGMACPLAPA